MKRGVSVAWAKFGVLDAPCAYMERGVADTWHLLLFLFSGGILSWYSVLELRWQCAKQLAGWESIDVVSEAEGSN